MPLAPYAISTSSSENAPSVEHPEVRVRWSARVVGAVRDPPAALPHLGAGGAGRSALALNVVEPEPVVVAEEEEVGIMPPHCDSVDGPVVTAAREALTSGEVQRVAPYVPAEDEAELRRTFDLSVAARALGSAAREVADRWFLETTVRLHRAGEGAPFTGLKPAGLDVGPVIPAAEDALESGTPDQLGELLCGVVRDQLRSRHGRAIALKERAGESVPRAREYVGAALGMQVWAHGLYRQALSEPHARISSG